MLEDAGALSDLGEHFGAGLYRREAEWLREREFARTADDILWRRTKLGLLMPAAGRRRVAEWMGG
jgi:glycerol-3-phosphate dehydrogenase